jgi:hypothetical protein
LISEIAGLTLLQELSPSDFETFKTAVHTLLGKSFIIRGVEKELYDFTLRNLALFDAYFTCMDAELVKDESLGVLAYRGPGDMRVYMGRDETLCLLVLRQVYEEKRLELSLAAFPSISVEEFQLKYKSMTGQDVKKTALVKSMQRLSSFKLITVTGPGAADLGSEAQIVLYPGIPLSVDREVIEEAIDNLTQTRESQTDNGEDSDADA